MPFEYYENLKKLVIIVESLLAPTINIVYIKEFGKISVEFVKEVSKIYPDTIMLSGMHEMLHLVQCTLDFVN